MYKVPVQQLVQPAAGMPLADQAGCVDLRQAPGIDPVVQQGGVLGHKGVALNMGEDRRVALSTDGKQRFINARRLDGGGKFNQNVACVGKGQLAQIKAGQSCGIVHLRPKLAGYAQPLGADRSRDLPEGSLAQFDKLFYCDALIMKVRRKDNADNAIGYLPAHKRHRHIQISGAVINARQDVAVQLYKRVFHSSVSCLES